MYFFEGGGDLQGGFGGGLDLPGVRPGAISSRLRPVGGDGDPGHFGGDGVDDADAGEGKRAAVQDLGAAVFGGVLHGDDDAAGAGDEVHGAAHAFDHFAGDHPVGEVAGCVDFHGAEDAEVDVAAADHGEGFGGGEEGGAGEDGDGFFAGVDEVGVFFAFERVGADAEHAVFAIAGRHPCRGGRGWR